MSDVTALLDQLTAGDIDLEEVADAFRTRTWPRRTRIPATDATDLYALDMSDPEAEPEGSFTDVAAYYAAHRLTDQQYETLAEAAASAMKNAPSPGTPAGAVNEGTS